VFESIDDVIERFARENYICDRRIATVVYLAEKLQKPILVEGPAGVGKTELAKTLALTLGSELIRLQCYEGLDEAKALYEWAYPKQLLYTQILRDKIGELLNAQDLRMTLVAGGRELQRPLLELAERSPCATSRLGPLLAADLPSKEAGGLVPACAVILRVDERQPRRRARFGRSGLGGLRADGYPREDEQHPQPQHPVS